MKVNCLCADFGGSAFAAFYKKGNKNSLLKRLARPQVKHFLVYLLFLVYACSYSFPLHLILRAESPLPLFGLITIAFHLWHQPTLKLRLFHVPEKIVLLERLKKD